MHLSNQPVMNRLSSMGKFLTWYSKIFRSTFNDQKLWVTLTAWRLQIQKKHDVETYTNESSCELKSNNDIILHLCWQRKSQFFVFKIHYGNVNKLMTSTIVIPIKGDCCCEFQLRIVRFKRKCVDLPPPRCLLYTERKAALRVEILWILSRWSFILILQY